jgi:hypothetical protein
MQSKTISLPLLSLLLKRRAAFLTTALFILFSSATFAQNKDLITNKTIIDLKKAGISKGVLKALIECADCNFETSTSSILNLQKAGIDEEIIIAMSDKMKTPAGNKQQSQANKTTVTAASVTNNSTVARLRNEGSGIFYRSESNIIEIDPTVYSQTKNSGNFVRNISGGFAKSTTKLSLSGPSANAQISTKKPVFYFVFNKSKDEGINSQAPLWFTNAMSPNEFMLVKLLTSKDKKGGRDVIVASGNDYAGTAQGVDEKQRVSFKYTKLENGIYEIYFEEDLEAGEYCFMYAGSMSASGTANPKVYDFGIK